MPRRWDEPFWIGDRFFSLEDITRIQSTVQQCRRVTRTELARILCEILPWKSLNGAPRIDSCYTLLDAMEASRFAAVPPKRSLVRRLGAATVEKQGEPLVPLEITASLADVQPISVVPVVSEEERLIWNATMARFHPLGYRRAFGARQHYQ